MELNYKRKLLFAQSGVSIEETYKGLRLRALEDNVKFKFTVADKISYSINEGMSWVNVTEADSEFPYTTLKNGDSIIIKGKFVNCTSTSATNGSIYATGLYEVSGNIMSLMADSIDETGNVVSTGMVTEDGDILSKDLSDYKYAFYKLFYEEETYRGNLQNAQDLLLPAEILSNYCYSYMFYKCTGLTKAPELRAETLATSCYSYMFFGCTGITKAPELPATKLATSCYDRLFQNCTGLTKAPELRAETLAQNCYRYMFFGCTGLITPPELPATTLKSNCYYSMFQGCTSLTEAPTLPATNLTTACYREMFSGCSSLSYIKALFTTTSWTTYTSNWVKGVAETGIFERSKNATWEIVVGDSAIPPGWEVISAYDPLTITNKGTTNINIGFNKKNNYILKYNIINTGDEIDTSLITNQWEGSVKELSPNQSIVFMGDVTNINEIGKFDITSASDTPNIHVSGSILSLVYGDKYNDHDTLPAGFKFTRLFADADITNASLLKLNIRDLSQNSYCYEEMFDGCASLINTPELPTTTLSEGCYQSMFKSCFSLQTMPVIKAITLAPYCYEEMFTGCDSLVNTTPLLATELAEGCYQSMFMNCPSLQTMPVIKATTLAPHCCDSMFAGCDSLVNTTPLLATELAESCYQSMFSYCESLTNAIGLRLSQSFIYAPSCFENMFSNCHSLNNLEGILSTNVYYSRSVSRTYAGMFEFCTSLIDASGICIFVNRNSQEACYGMFRGCTALTNPPELNIIDNLTPDYAQGPAPFCYAYMFEGCTALEVGPDLKATDLVGTLMSNNNDRQGAYNCYEGMFRYCTSLKGFKSTPDVIQLPATTLASYCYYHMFEGCTSITSANLCATSPVAYYGNINNGYAYGCYFGTFNNCSSLKSIRMADTFMVGGIIPILDVNNRYRFPYEWEDILYYDYPEDDNRSSHYYINEYWLNDIIDPNENDTVTPVGYFYLSADSQLGYIVYENFCYGAVPVNQFWDANSSNWRIVK